MNNGIDFVDDLFVGPVQSPFAFDVGTNDIRQRRRVPGGT